MDTIKDYLNSFLGIVAIVLPLLFIPELKNKKSYLTFCVVTGIILFYLGIDKISRDNKEKGINENRRISDSTTVAKMNINIHSLTQTMKKDSVNDAGFKNELRSRFKIVDSANKPVFIGKVDNRHTNNTHIDKADKVDIH